MYSNSMSSYICQLFWQLVTYQMLQVRTVIHNVNLIYGKFLTITINTVKQWSQSMPLMDFGWFIEGKISLVSINRRGIVNIKVKLVHVVIIKDGKRGGVGPIRCLSLNALHVFKFFLNFQKQFLLEGHIEEPLCTSFTSCGVS